MGRRSAQGRSNAIKSARTALGLTQAELAAAAGVTRQTVVAVEAGDYAPSVYLALALAERLGRSVEELFGHGAAAGVDAGGAGHAGGNEESNR
jgi:putative transcriptional regulator